MEDDDDRCSQESGFAANENRFESAAKRRRGTSVVRVALLHSTTEEEITESASQDELSSVMELNANALSEEVTKYATNSDDEM